MNIFNKQLHWQSKMNRHINQNTAVKHTAAQVDAASVLHKYHLSHVTTLTSSVTLQ